MSRIYVVILFLLVLLAAPVLPAQSVLGDASGSSVAAIPIPESAPADPSQASSSSGGSSDNFFDRWFAMVAKTRAEQPHWMTPVVTVTPRLEQEFRYDILRQTGNTGITSVNYGNAKGLEIIPASHFEVILVAPPAYIEHNNPKVKDGFGDWAFLIKYRIVAANEEHGNYILTFFFQSTLPTGQYKNGNTDAVITPTLAYGKGFGDFDIQGTVGGTLPTGNEAVIGRTIPWNNTFQYHAFKRLWPEVEVNYTHFFDGPSNGKTQVYMTPGLVLGRFRLWKTLGFAVGGGFQVAATHFHNNNHNGIVTVRFPF